MFSLFEEEGDVRERIKTFLFNKRDVLNEIFVEKEEDSSEEVLMLEEEVKKCDPLEDFMQNKNTQTLCKHFLKGFCRHGTSCSYSHESQDCRDHTDFGKCVQSHCPDRHRNDCKYFNTRKGCNRRYSCAFLHRGNQDATEDDDKVSKDTDIAANEKI